MTGRIPGRLPDAAHNCRQSANPRKEGYCDCGQRLPDPADPRTVFDPAFAREFLQAAERLAGVTNGWTDKVFDRVEQMNSIYGSSYRTIGVRKLLKETDDETLDLGGWPLMLALVIPSLDDRHDDDERLEALQACQQIAALGVRAHALVERLRELLL